MLDIPYFNRHPRLQKGLELFVRAAASQVNFAILTIYGVIIGLASYFRNYPLILWSSRIYVFASIAVVLATVYIILSSNYLYRIKTYKLRWEIRDLKANQANFELSISAVLNRTADAFHLYFPLDEYVDNLTPYSRFVARYEGYRKKIQATLTAHHSPGYALDFKASGKKNLKRQDGINVLEIPIDFPVDIIEIELDFMGLVGEFDIVPDLLVRYGGEVKKLKASKSWEMSSLKNGNHRKVTYKIRKPNYGYSYLLYWERI